MEQSLTSVEASLVEGEFVNPKIKFGWGGQYINP
jgi:hypothetical protein